MQAGGLAYKAFGQTEHVPTPRPRPDARRKADPQAASSRPQAGRPPAPHRKRKLNGFAASCEPSGFTSRCWPKTHSVSKCWAFISDSPGAKAHYRRRRDDHGDWHDAAQRHLFNRMLGQLYDCLQHHRLFDEDTAFPAALARAGLTR